MIQGTGNNTSSDPLRRQPETFNESTIKKIERERIDALKEAGIEEEKILHEIHQNRGNWDRSWSDNRTQGQDDLDFLVRDQWTSVERGEFRRLFKSAQQYNKLMDVFRKTIAEQRKNTPDLAVRSLTGKATQKDLDTKQDVVKTIAYQSRNDIVYQTAFASSLGRGYGAFLVDVDYETPTSFKKVIRYHRITDPDKCFWDPRATEPTKADGNYCGFTTVMSWEEFETAYPNIQRPSNFSTVQTLMDLVWQTRESVVVCDYYVKEWRSIEVYQLSNGDSISAEKYEELVDLHSRAKKHVGRSLHGKLIPKLPEIKKTRYSEDYKIMHYRVIQDKILEFTEFPSRHLPLIFVDGDSYYINDKQYSRSLIYYAKDAQRFYNYLMCEMLAQIKNANRAQWVGTPSNIKGQEWMWKNPEAQQGILIANPDEKTGAMPEKHGATELPQTLLLAIDKAGRDVNEIVGMFDPSLTNDNQGQSGIAVQRKQMNTSMGSYVFFDNLNRAIEQGGRVSLDLMNNIVDDNYSMTLKTKNGNVKNIIFNQTMPDGTYRNYYIDGEYDIEIDAGPSFAVQKDLAMQLMLQMCQVNPNVFPLIADLLAKNFDLENMPQIAERLKTLVPAQILAKENGQPPPPPQPDPQAQLAQMEMAARQSEIKVREQKIQQDQQKMEMDRQLNQQKMELEAAKLRQEGSKAVLDHHAEIQKAELGYTSNALDTLTELHKHHMTLNQEKTLAKQNRPSKPKN